jgi:hypothetical protein
VSILKRFGPEVFRRAFIWGNLLRSSLKRRALFIEKCFKFRGLCHTPRFCISYSYKSPASGITVIIDVLPVVHLVRDIARTVSNYTGDCRLQSNLTPTTVLCQVDPVYTPTLVIYCPLYCYPAIYVWIFQSGLLPSEFYTKILSAFLIAVMRAICITNLILSDHFTGI